MSLSFEDSLKNNMATVAPMVATMDVAAPATASADIMTLEESAPIAAYSGEDGNWVQHTDYEYYSVFNDERITLINEKKEILLNCAQFNIEQEENSQYIPFEMSRRYDGFDLAKDAKLSIHYTTKGGYHGVSMPINVSYNDTKLRFGWLIDGSVTSDVGTITFAIHAIGSVIGSKGSVKAYTWKTKENKSLDVIKSTCKCNEPVKVDDTWVQEIVTSVAERVAEEIKNVEVGAFVEEAKASADRAEQAAVNAESTVTEAVNGIINDYSTTSEMEAYVAEQIRDIDIDSKLTDYAKTDEVNTLVGNLGESSTVVGYVDATVAGVDVSEQIKDLATKKELEDAIKNVDVTEQIKDFATKKELEDAIEAVDVSDQLVDYAKSADIAKEYSTKTDTQQYVSTSLEPYATKDDVSAAISAADISDKLNDYYKKDETYSRDEIDTALDNVTVDLTGYATEKFVTDKTDVLSASVGKNTEALGTLNKTVGDIQEAVSSIDTSPRLTYDVVYNDTEDPEVGENVFVFYEIENEGAENESREAKKKFTIVGGSGGGATSSNLKISYITTSPLVVTVDQKAEIKYKFSGTDSSDDFVTEATATWKINGRVIATTVAYGESDTHTGENTFDITEYLSVGTQKIDLAITDEAGSLVTKKWTVQKVDVRLESSFRDDFTYPIAPVSFDYTPYGAITKDIHFILDGKEIGTETTGASGIQMSYEIPAQEHGAHLFEIYMTASVNGNDIESNHIVKDIIWYDPESAVPVIGSVFQTFTARQYDATNIVYTVYDPTTETPTVEIAVDGVVVSTPTLDKVTNTYSFKTDVIGQHTITITCGETVKTLIANIEKIDVNITPVTAGLVFDFNPSGKSNNDVDRVWSTDTVAMAVSDNFDWVNGGYQYDANGDQYFCIKAGTSATIDYTLFADDAKKNGKEFKLVFKTTNVARPDATFLSCVDNTTDTDHIGIKMDVHEAFIYGQSGNLHLPYSEGDVIEFEFNISKNTEDVPMVMGYEDGVSTRPMVYDDSFNFTQNTPQVISLGSTDCDLHIYRFKVYNSSLAARGILNNFIADARNAEEMIARYDRNQIYDENGNLDPDILAEKCPWLRVYKLSAPYFTNNKSDKVPGTTIQQIYKNGDPILDNWTCYNAMHAGQGTSSNNYGASGRNLDLIMDKSGIDNVDPYFVLGDGTKADKIALTRTSVPNAYYNFKANIASSNNFTNALLAKRYNEFQPYNRAFVRDDSVDTAHIKDTMEFFNSVVFIQETNEDLSTHREFADSNWHK